MKRVALAAFAWLALWAVPASAQVTGVSPAQMFGCTRSAQTSTVGSNVVLAASTGATAQIYVCAFTFAPAGTTPSVHLFWAATGTSCASSNGNVTPVMAATQPLVDGHFYYAGLPPVPNGQDLCAAIVAGTGSTLIVYYTQF